MIVTGRKCRNRQKNGNKHQNCLLHFPSLSSGHSLIVALPDQSVGGLTRSIEHDELIAAGKLILPALVGSDPTWNQSCLQVMDHVPGRFVDLECSKVRVEAGEHFT